MPRKRTPKKELKAASFYDFCFPEYFIEAKDPLKFRGPPKPTKILIADLLGIPFLSDTQMQRLWEISRSFFSSRDMELKRPRNADVRVTLFNLEKTAATFLRQEKTKAFFDQLNDLDQWSIDTLTSFDSRFFGFFDSYRQIYRFPIVIQRALKCEIPLTVTGKAGEALDMTF